MPNEFIARNGVISRGNLVVSGSVVSTSPASFSGSLNVTGSIGILNTNPSSSVLLDITGSTNNLLTFRSNPLLDAGQNGLRVNVSTAGYDANSSRVAYNFQVGGTSYFTIANYGLATFSQGIESKTMLLQYNPSSTTTLRVYAQGSAGNAIETGGSEGTVHLGSNTVNTKVNEILRITGKGTTSSTTALLVQNANASSSLVINDAGYVGIGASPSTTSPVYLYQNTGSSISDLEIFHEYPTSVTQRAYANLTLTTKQPNGNHGSQYINFKHVGGNVAPFVGGALIFDLYDGGTGGYSYYQVQTKVSGGSLATRFAIDENGNTLLGRQAGNESIIITEPTFAATSPLPTKTIGIVSNNQASGWGGFGLIIKAGPANNNLLTNLKGGELYLRAGESLGTGGSDILLQIPTPSGSAGTVLNSTYRTAMFISGSGNIGIGTSTPSASLHISGSSNSALLEIDSPAVNNILYVSGSGNVGIGTSTPTSTLHVKGLTTVYASSSFKVENSTTSGSFKVTDTGKLFLAVNNPIGYNEPQATNSASMYIYEGPSNSGRAGITLHSGNSDTNGSFLHLYNYVSHWATGIQHYSSGGGAIQKTRFYIGYDASQKLGDAGNVMTISSNGLGINTLAAEISANLQVKGSGATSSTTALLIQNANASASLTVTDDRYTYFSSDNVASNFSRMYHNNSTGGTILEYGIGGGFFTRATFGTTGVTFNNYGNTGLNTIVLGSTLGVANIDSSLGNVGEYPQLKVRSSYFGISTSTPAMLFSVFKSDGTGNDLEKIQIYNGNTGVVSLIPQQSGSVAVGKTTANSILDVLGNTTVTGSFTVTTGSLIEFQVNQTGVKIGNATTDSHTVTGSVSISSSFSTSGSALTVYKSGSSVLDIQGSQGQLFSVIDALSGSLMSVNDVSGLPILEVFSDDRVVMGTYGAPGLTVSGSLATVATGSSAPSGAAPEGTFKFAVVGGLYYIYAYVGGAWRSGSLS
jgi:hypothetical protein